MQSFCRRLHFSNAVLEGEKNQNMRKQVKNYQNTFRLSSTGVFFNCEHVFVGIEKRFSKEGFLKTKIGGLGVSRQNNDDFIQLHNLSLHDQDYTPRWQLTQSGKCTSAERERYASYQLSRLSFTETYAESTKLLKKLKIVQRLTNRSFALRL